MPKIRYRSFNFRPKTLAVIVEAQKIIAEYQADGLDLTVRQLYYQFVSKDLIPNNERSYKRIVSIVNDARLAGMIDWNSITDRTRHIRQNSHWDSPADIVRGAARQYQIDKWQGQDYRAEVWIEKDALIGVIAQICKKLDVPYFSCRGYSSQSAQWRAAQRLIDWEEGSQLPGQPRPETIIFHLGDHDPSGIDMTRDNQDRLCFFGAGVDVRRIALTMGQIEELKPPPNFAKLSDSRSRDYVARFGKSSWELDALNPKYLHDLITEHILSIRDEDRWETMVEKEKREKELLITSADRLADELEDEEHDDGR